MIGSSAHPSAHEERARLRAMIVDDARRRDLSAPDAMRLLHELAGTSDDDLLDMIARTDA